MQLESIQQCGDWIWNNIQNIEALAAFVVIIAGLVIWLFSRKNKQKDSKSHTTTFEDKVKVEKDFIMGNKITHKNHPPKGSKD